MQNRSIPSSWAWARTATASAKARPMALSRGACDIVAGACLH